MTKRHAAYLIIALDALFIVALAVVAFLLSDFRSPPLAALRAKVEASSSFADLRPRALKILSANEAADRAIQHLHGVIIHLSRLGIVVTASNLVLFYLFMRDSQRGNAKT
jgi:hypothetical protein